MSEEISTHFHQAREVLDAFINNPENLKRVSQAGELMVASLRQNGKIISCGNGGSMCDAMHFAEELSGRYRENRKALAAVSISDPSHISCVANDFGYDFIFSRYIEALGIPGDVLLAISTSGNSANVVQAAIAAKAKGIKIVALTGNKGGKLADMADVEVRVPHNGYADRIQEIHIKVIHSLIDYIEQKLT